MSGSEHSTSLKEIEESKDISKKLEPHHIKCISPEKSQFSKQKHHSIKRRDKRNFEVPSSKAKYVLSSLKLGAAIFSSKYGGNNCFGLYGLKLDIHDVTKLMDVPPLDKLLMGTFDFPGLNKVKEKKTSNTSERFLNSFRNGYSIPQFPKSVHMAEMDSSSNKKMSTCPMSSVCAVGRGSNGNKEQSCASDMSSCQKDPCGENESPSCPLDFPLCQLTDVLERIAFTPSEDLESLLLDMSKLAVTTKGSNNLHSGKQVCCRPNLPSFAWAHAFGGHYRVNSDAVKLSTSRSTCQGKWARIGVITSSTDIDCGCFTNLDSFSYDQSLVPSTGSSDNKVFPSLFANLPFCQWNSSSPVTCYKDPEATAGTNFSLAT
ncbi:uncharacterized protein LOC133297699 [Gastrolobium bilobum]|uniref:uncharacterized protein LOC133297699 n=1 Tax=Gastrolobium bilobum TaxID=150636 RepID=UPI002AB0D58E|nr:uncharacterized protein LOC133297699 [Gastrolobium bilobum]